MTWFRLYDLFIDRHASHVMQTVIRRIPQLLIAEFHNGIARIAERKGNCPVFIFLLFVFFLLLCACLCAERDDAVEEADEDGSPKVPCMTTLLKNVCKQMHGSWVELIIDPSGTFIARDLIQILTGHVLRPKGTGVV